MDSTKFTKLVTELLKPVQARVCYLAAGQVFQFQRHGDQWQLTPSEQHQLSARVVILGRAHYREHHEIFPLGRGTDLYKLVRRKAQLLAPQTLYRIGNTLEGKTSVTFYTLQGLDNVQLASVLVVPETLLLGKSLDADQAASYPLYASKGSKQVYVANVRGQVVSSLQTLAIANLAMFTNQQGIASYTSVIIDAGELINRLHQHLFSFLLNPLGLYLASPKRQLALMPLLKLCALPLVAGLTLYLYAAEQVSAGMLASARDEFKQTSANANQVLVLRSQTETNIARYQQLAQFDIEPQPSLAIWQSLARLYQQGMTLRRFEQKGPEQYQLQILAESASEVLSKLLSEPGVASARFEGSIIRQRDQEMANIALTFSVAGEQ